ncbi:unnamed protein product, partial [Laminaria digitata]
MIPTRELAVDASGCEEVGIPPWHKSPPTNTHQQPTAHLSILMSVISVCTHAPLPHNSEMVAEAHARYQVSYKVRTGITRCNSCDHTRHHRHQYTQQQVRDDSFWFYETREFLPTTHTPTTTISTVVGISLIFSVISVLCIIMLLSL